MGLLDGRGEKTARKANGCPILSTVLDSGLASDGSIALGPAVLVSDSLMLGLLLWRSALTSALSSTSFSTSVLILTRLAFSLALAWLPGQSKK